MAHSNSCTPAFLAFSTRNLPYNVLGAERGLLRCKMSPTFSFNTAPQFNYFYMQHLYYLSHLLQVFLVHELKIHLVKLGKKKNRTHHRQVPSGVGEKFSSLCQNEVFILTFMHSSSKLMPAQKEVAACLYMRGLFAHKPLM